ncbi:protein ZINC INDUCED FACILITATOR-LIKE 1 isoform X5 [Setaria viridis]|uniref:protein ZINC INDUCED FACILITATOR-LIKE 1 isoform X5 n=1 Tax=Setaria viridis TaxID=4556 RepID=UPI003B3AC528
MGSEEAPLLLPAPAVEGCPGCVMERRKASSKGRIPYKELFFVGVTSLASSLPITCLFPFIYFMVRDFHISKTEEDIGFYAGFLAASYMVGRAIAAIFWGILSDRIGRKPVIAFSILSVVIFNTLFGLSTTYWMAIATRFVLGALNGLLAPIKVNTAWALGLIVGPALGGFLAQETIHKHKVPEKDTKIVKALPPKDNYRDSPRRKSLLQNKPWVSTMLPYCLFSLHDTAYSEILSLWAVSDRKYGGLSFSTKDIGEVLAMAGASLLVYQLIIYRWVHKVRGTVNSSRVASAVFIVVLATYPFMTYLSGVKLSFALYSAAMMKSALAITVTTGICLLQNNAVFQEQRGTANGISTTVMSFFKSVAPVGAGALFSWAQKRQDATFLPGDQVVFVVLNLVQLLGLISTFEPFLVLPALPE